MLLFMSVSQKNINNFDTSYRNTYKNVQCYYTLRNAYTLHVYCGRILCYVFEKS